MSLAWIADGKFSRAVTVDGRHFDATAQTHGRKCWVSGWTLRELDAPGGFCVAILGNELLIRELDSIVFDHLRNHEYSIADAVQFAIDNEAQGLVGEEKLGAVQYAFYNASVYAEQYGFTVQSFIKRLKERGAR